MWIFFSTILQEDLVGMYPLCIIFASSGLEKALSQENLLVPTSSNHAQVTTDREDAIFATRSFLEFNSDTLTSNLGVSLMNQTVILPFINIIREVFSNRISCTLIPVVTQHALWSVNVLAC
ncbi:hypothetical protein TNCV_4574831 [Trichonephila clavipes]|nr:hypothetical protein TNCV_4574831 [Trichonephila clavipes]